MLVEMGPETVTGMEEKETAATVVEMAEAVRAAFPGSPEMADVAEWLEEAPIGRHKEENA